MLENDVMVLPQHGRGVQVIYRSHKKDIFVIGGIESLSEATKRNGRKIITEVKKFEEIEADEKINLKTGFDIGSPLYHIERVRIVDGTLLILDRNYFLRSETPGLTKKICEGSIYQYLENTLHMNITTSHRLIQAEQATLKDQKYLDLHNLDFVLCVSD